MNYLQYYPVDVVNGKGIRATLFVAGCDIGCPACFNKKAWNPRAGKAFTPAMEARIIADLNDKRIKHAGLSLLGGEPLYQANLSAVKKLILRVRKDAPQANIWLWSGHILADLTPEQKAVVDLVDIFIDGPFELEKADPALAWRGSANQKIYKINPDSIF